MTHQIIDLNKNPAARSLVSRVEESIQRGEDESTTILRGLDLLSWLYDHHDVPFLSPRIQVTADTTPEAWDVIHRCLRDTDFQLIAQDTLDHEEDELWYSPEP